MILKSILMEDNGDGTSTQTMTFEEQVLVSVIPLSMDQLFVAMSEQANWQEIAADVGLEMIMVPDGPED